MLKINFYLLFVFFSLALMLNACSEQSDSMAMEKTPWPDLLLMPLFDQQIIDDKDLRKNLLHKDGNQWVFINVWATWCEPCRKEMPMLQQLASHFNEDDFSMLLVSIDTDLNLVKEFVLQYGIELPVYISSQENIEQSLNNYSYPVSYLIAPSGKIVKVYQGAKEWQSPEIVEQIKSVIRNSSYEEK